MKTKTIILIIVIISASCLSNILYGQINKIVTQEKSYYSLTTGTHDPVYSSSNDVATFSAEEQNLLNQIKQARLNNNQALASELIAQLNLMHGSLSVPLYSDPNAVCGTPVNIRVPFEPDYMMSQITDVSTHSIATATVPSNAPNGGRIWAAVTQYNSSGSDTIKLFYSDNGGAFWNFYDQWWYNNYNIDYRANELDITVLYDGTDVWLYGISGFDDLSSGRTLSNVWRINTTAFSFFCSNLDWPGSNTGSNKYYNPRIATDNTVYTSTSFVYLSASFDSTYSSGVHWLRQKYAHITSPFASSPSINYALPSTANNGGFFWNSNNLPSNVYVYTDIAYFSNYGNDRVITLYNIDYPGNLHSMFLAWSDNYGATVSGYLILSEGNESKGARFAFNGGTGNRNGMITYLRYNNGNDWDPYYRNTTSGGSTSGSWNQGSIDPSNRRARYVDVMAVAKANNHFKVAYIQDINNGYAAYYTGWNGSSFNSPNSLVVNNAPCDSAYAKIRAGYKLGGGDDCLALWTGDGAWGVYGTHLCETTVGMHNNQIPSVYVLHQNYPNPFNPATDIKFSIPQRAFTKLVVYDITGKVVSTLVNTNLNAGNYSFSFDASTLTSGVYFYRLTSGDFTSTKKMVLIK